MLKRIAIDLDGVVADFTGEMNRILREQVGVNIAPDLQPTDWGWGNAKLPPDALKRAWQTIDSTENFWETLKPLPDAVTLRYFFNQYAERGVDFYFITARGETSGKSAKTQSEAWLRRVLASPRQAISVLPVRNSMSKAQVINSLMIDFSIDDYAPAVVNAAHIPNHRAYLLQRPWNSEGEYHSVRIVDSLATFFEEVL